MGSVLQYILSFLIMVIVLSLFAYIVGHPKINPAIKLFLRVVILIASILVYSFVAGIYFIISTFLFQEALYYVNGASIEQTNGEAIVQLSITFGIIYIIAFLLSEFLMSKLRLRHWKYKIWKHMTLLLIVIFTYPNAVHLIFPNIMITFKGAIYLAFLIICIWFLQTPLFKRRVVGGDSF